MADSPRSFPAPPIRSRGLPRCTGCGLPPSECLCAELPLLPVRTRVVILMHHIELKKSSNTGRLVARVLAGAEIRVRGEIDAAPRPPLPAGRRLVLYPAPGARELSVDDAREPPVLLVPDGNWTQTRRAYQRDPDARDAEPVILPPGEPTRYGLRRQPREGTVSTMEAVARALGVLEGPEVEQQMMTIFDRFVERAARVRRSGRAEPG